MLSTTLSRVRCLCGGTLQSPPTATQAPVVEIWSGYLVCQSCRAAFLVLAGVALLVEDAHSYLIEHVKGISKLVPAEDIPVEFRDDFLEACAEIPEEHIEEDLEADRVNSLYLMNHYLSSSAESAKPEWWKPLAGEGSPLIDRLIRENWDQGPFSVIGQWVKGQRFESAVELGCGVGGLHRVLKASCGFYLGADSSFASIALARHLALGAAYSGALRIPEDLLQGGVSREIHIPTATSFDGSVDFVVTDLQTPAISRGNWDLSVSLNTIDMLEDPAALPREQGELLRTGGTAIQSCPYIWHEAVSRELRGKLPAEARGNSARAVEWLYEEAGFELQKKLDHVPWLFFKHLRQLEVYSVHMFSARKR